MAREPLGVSAPVLGALSSGTYRVAWRTAAADGHVAAGSFEFVIAAESLASAASVADTSERLPARGHSLIRIDPGAEEPMRVNAYAATRWLEFSAILAVLGAIVFRLVVLRGLERRAAPLRLERDLISAAADASRRFGQSALILLLIAAVVRVYGEARSLSEPGGLTTVTSLRALLTESSWGHGWTIGTAGVVTAAIGFAWARRALVGWGVASAGAVAIAIGAALTGHAAVTRPVAVSVLDDIIHLLAVSAWLGTLLVAVIVGIPAVRRVRRQEREGEPTSRTLAALARAFHPVALTCASVTLLTGLLSAWLRLPAFSSLWETVYGRALVLKIALVVVVVAVGAYNWRRMLPALGDDGSAARFRRSASVELTFAGLVLAVTAILVALPTPAVQTVDAGRPVGVPPR
jgi:copper transport protein